jgi:hypothetical protein
MEPVMMNIVQRYVTELSNKERDDMFQMYVISYTLGGQPLWFKTPDELFSRYPCFVTFDDLHLTVYAMFQLKSTSNKISLVCHNGDVDGKYLSIQLRVKLIHQPGWILEASDKVSWLLRKHDSPIFRTKDEIETALNIKDNPNDKIVMNEQFDVSDKTSNQYTRIYKDGTNTYNSIETLFGTSLCTYDNMNCIRRCIRGGKTKKTKRKYFN